jgi:chloramphenicol O-acetyltransferase type A
MTTNGEWLDLESWPRASHFTWFVGYEQPFFNVCTEIDVSALHECCHAPGGPSFFLATLFHSARAANEIEAFRLRLRGDRVWRHPIVHPGSAVMRDNQTYAFTQFEYVPDFAEFARQSRAIIDHVSTRNDPLASDARDDVIYYSVLPWIRFTSCTNAHRSLKTDSVPRIVFGQHFERDTRRWLPVSVEVHHALVDGLDVGRFFERFSASVENPL